MKQKQDLGDLRQSYELDELTDAAKKENPITLFGQWFTEATVHPDIVEANAMSIVTQGVDGYPKARVVLLKHYDAEGFVFYTNYQSQKGQAIAKNKYVGLSFFWPALQRQVIIKGKAEKLADTVSDAYFNSRPLGSRLGALASPQSQPIADRSVLEQRLQSLEEMHATTEPKRPIHWGGYLVVPVEIEFWQGRPNRLHDRLVFTYTTAQQWTVQRLAP